MFDYYFYHEKIEVESLKELLLRAVISDYDSSENERLVNALIDAYLAAVEQDEDSAEVTMLDTEQAHDVFAKVFAKNYGIDPEEVYDGNSVGWPEALPWRRRLPKFLVVVTARAIAQHWKAMNEHFRRYMEEQDRQEGKRV